MSPRKALFVREYLVDLNAAQAAIRAGYSKRSAEQNGPRLLRNAEVAAAVQEAMATRAERVQVTADDVLRGLKLIALSDIGEVLDFTGNEPKLRPASEIPEAARRAICGVKVRRYVEGHGDDAREVEVTEFRLWDKVGALTKLAQHLGMFKVHVEHSGRVGVSSESLTNEERIARLHELIRIAHARRAGPPDAGGTGRVGPADGRSKAGRA